MARYTGPRTRISRRFGVPIFGPSKYLERRNYGPGVHGPKSRRKVTDYALGLLEKQKLRYYYGLMERQFRNVYERAGSELAVTEARVVQRRRRAHLQARRNPADRQRPGRRRILFPLGNEHEALERWSNAVAIPHHFNASPPQTIIRTASAGGNN